MNVTTTVLPLACIALCLSLGVPLGARADVRPSPAASGATITVTPTVSCVEALNKLTDLFATNDVVIDGVYSEILGPDNATVRDPISPDLPFKETSMTFQRQAGSAGSYLQTFIIDTHLKSNLDAVERYSDNACRQPFDVANSAEVPIADPKVAATASIGFGLLAIALRRRRACRLG